MNLRTILLFAMCLSLVNCTTLPNYYQEKSHGISKYCNLVHAGMDKTAKNKSFSYRSCLVKGTELHFAIDQRRWIEWLLGFNGAILIIGIIAEWGS